jgi:ribonuclease R
LVEGDYSLVGRRSGRKFRMGDKLYIKVISANLAKRQLDFEWVIKPEVEDQLNEITDTPDKSSRGKGKGRKKKKQSDSTGE